MKLAPIYLMLWRLQQLERLAEQAMRVMGVFDVEELGSDSTRKRVK